MCVIPKHTSLCVTSLRWAAPFFVTASQRQQLIYEVIHRICFNLQNLQYILYKYNISGEKMKCFNDNYTNANKNKLIILIKLIAVDACLIHIVEQSDPAEFMLLQKKITVTV